LIRVDVGSRHCTTVDPLSLICVTYHLAIDSLVLTVHKTSLTDWLNVFSK